MTIVHCNKHSTTIQFYPHGDKDQLLMALKEIMDMIEFGYRIDAMKEFVGVMIVVLNKR